MKLVWVVLVAGCGRIGFSSLDDASTSRDTSSMGSDAAGATRCDWSAGQPAVLSGPAQVASLTSGMGEADPFLVPGDPHQMYFTSGRTGAGDIYHTHRAALDTSWDPPTAVTELDTTGASESALVVDAGALHGYYDVLTGGGTSAKLYEVSRAAASDPFTVVRELTELDTRAVQYDPFPSPDELTFHFTAGSTANNLQLYEATRANASAMWANVKVEPYSTAAASQQSLTSDQLVVFWSADNGSGNFDLYFATRASPTDPFGVAQRLSLSTTDNDYEPYIREDGCELHWAHGPGGAGQGAIFEVMFKPPA